ncbi:putative transcriptional regulator [Gottschalkia purinilytica]|uniref:Putative transcriptional regulator n=1 Tax=Gottschalkia purinilytica TaxID=1503 RepID=A0A0L0WAS4_GOTPU|nr:helix-turn-helix transcriptional regulator [Gottschalkia purinilytica]KNF08598.1 putative transcriptional regulator [Gottschalkia purinilytica]
MMELSQALAIVLKNNRHICKLSQEELAHRCGLDRTYISLLERGKRKPTINSLFAISKHLNLKLSEFIDQIEKLLEENKENMDDM